LHEERARKDVSALSRASPTTRAEALELLLPRAGAEPEAIQFCASVDFVRPDPDTANDAFGDDVAINPGYTNPKGGTSARKRDSQSKKGIQKRAKK
jgi:hypothetical protein